MPKVVIAPNAFTGSISAPEAAAALARGMRASGWKVALCPVADGGPGTRSVLEGRVPPGVGVIETAEHSGLGLGLDPLRADTYAVGQAVAAQAGEVWVGLGGSRSTDGGTGFARALGWRFLDRSGRELAPGGGSLEGLDEVVPPPARPGLRLVALCDVWATLPEAASVFAPQKGASPAEVMVLEAGLARLASVTGVRGDVPGDGAAGGLGYGMRVFGEARFESGIEVVARAVGLETALAGADLCVTGEGSVDDQTLKGKGPAVVAELTAAAGVPLVVVGGRVDPEVAARLGAVGWVELTALGSEPREQPARYLERAGAEVARRWAAAAWP